MNKIVIELSKDDRDLLAAIMFNQEKLIDLLQGLGKPLIAPQAQEAEPVEQVDQTAAKVDDSASQAPEPTPLPDIGDGSEVPAPHIEAAAAEPTPTPTHTREDVQRKVVELCAAGKKPEVKEIVNAYAERVGAIPENILGVVMAKLCALEG